MKVCMLAYAHYLNDARIKCYVSTLVDNGHEVDVIALRFEGEPKTEALATGTIFRIMDKYQGHSAFMYVWSYLQFLIKAFLFLTVRAFRNRYEVIHVHNMPNVLVYCAAVPRLLGARLILDVHDLMPVNYMAKFGAGERDLPVLLLKIEQWFSALFVHRMICADHNQQDYLAVHCGIPRDKITVFMNLPYTGVFGNPPTEPRNTNGKFRIVYHGTIAHRLGIDLILRAVAKASESVPADLWIYGGGDFLPDALQLSSELDLNEKVHFSKSFFPVEQIPTMVAGMDMGIIGNRRNLACEKYMLPVKLLEYVYLNLPVVAPRLEIIGRYFDDSMVRFYESENVEEMAEAIVYLYRHKEERERLANSAAMFYQKYNIQAQASSYLDLLAAPKLQMQALPEHHG